MSKRILSFLGICILSFTLMNGCINNTKPQHELVAPVQKIENKHSAKIPSGYTDFRNLTKNTSRVDSASAPINDAKNIDNKQYPIISYSGYQVLYNPYYKIPIWVKYELVPAETDGPYSRKGLKFCQDPSVNVPQAEDQDYRNSGWSRGHMAPAGDFKWSATAMEETFYFTNCCPQNQSLNGGQWSTLEKKVRNWATKYGKINVVTGPLVFDNQYGTIGKNKVVVPDAFFKAVLAGEQCIAFVMYNRAENENMQKCAMSVDKLEELSGIDFFYKLEDEIENKIEATYSLKYWNL